MEEIKWPYSCSFVGCFNPDLFKIAHSILVWFPSGFFFKHFIRVQVVQTYNSSGTATAWTNSPFNSSKRSDFHTVINLLIALRAFLMHMLTSISIDEILLPRYMNSSTNSRGLPLNKEMVPSWLKHIETNVSCCLLQAMQ